MYSVVQLSQAFGTWFGTAPAGTKQFEDKTRIRLISQMISDVSRVLQKLLIL